MSVGNYPVLSSTNNLVTLSCLGVWCVGSGVRGEVSVSGEYLGLQSVTREETSAAGTSHSDTDSVMCLTGVSSCVFLVKFKWR